MSDEFDFSAAKRGPVDRGGSQKARITIRIDEDVLQWFRDEVHRAGGGNYQTLINQALRAHIAQDSEPIEERLRRIIREELARAGERAGGPTGVQKRCPTNSEFTIARPVRIRVLTPDLGIPRKTSLKRHNIRLAPGHQLQPADGDWLIAVMA